MPDGMSMLGHVGREHAARLAPLMDAGVAFGAWVSAARIDPAHIDRPGVDIAIERRQMAEVF